MIKTIFFVIKFYINLIENNNNVELIVNSNLTKSSKNVF